MISQSEASSIHGVLRRRLCSGSLALSCHSKEKEEVVQGLKRVVHSKVKNNCTLKKRSHRNHNEAAWLEEEKESTCMMLVGTGAQAGMRLVLNSAINEVLYSTDCINDDDMMDKNKKTGEVKKNKEEKRNSSKPRAIVIRLNGVIHSGVDEARAMREITGQMCALTGPKLPRDSFNSSLSFVVDSLKSDSISAIFVLEAFELFALSPRQSFLYALVDLLAVSDVVVGVFGISSRLDTKDLLERRVLSRFGAGQVVFTHLPLYPSPQSLPLVLLEMLTFGEGERGVINEDSRLEWNKRCEELLSQSDMIQVINSWAGLGRELEWFMRLLALALGREEGNNGRSVFLTQRALMEACDVLEPDLQLQMLRNLSMPELIQVVAMTKLERRSQKPYGIEAVLAECQNFRMMSSYNTPHRYEDPVMRTGFTHLLHSGVTEAVSATGGRSIGHGAVQVRLQVNPDYVIEAMREETITSPLTLQHWCTRMS